MQIKKLVMVIKFNIIIHYHEVKEAMFIRY